ncbi:hypothetical protein O6H91_06G006700 [Diphasiastrum complanatum]|uniref:Uncharacterized protein n=1 Tax=Diphasiastrum complanatum TaxID=34168 RepID=A0ACC2DA72_DIPCM|nr:hypothetical protein O6H91_06G006700 [Diphasiastrum complanatum]
MHTHCSALLIQMHLSSPIPSLTIFLPRSIDRSLSLSLSLSLTHTHTHTKTRAKTINTSWWPPVQALQGAHCNHYDCLCNTIIHRGLQFKLSRVRIATTMIASTTPSFIAFGFRYSESSNARSILSNKLPCASAASSLAAKSRAKSSFLLVGR